MTLFTHAKVSHGDRRMTWTFDGPVAPEEQGMESEVWHHRIKITCDHNKAKKMYEARISRCRACHSPERGYSMERFEIFGDPMHMLTVEPAARFSENKFEAFCAQVRSACEALLADTLDERPAVALLRQAQEFSLIRN